MLAFVHIPKTAGGTVTKMLADAYGSKFDAGNFFRGPEKTLNKIGHRPRGGWASWYDRGGRLAVGHVPYGVFRDHLPAETRYMTFLREPVDRVLSHYFRHFWPARFHTEIESLNEAMIERSQPELNNFATRFLCGDPDPLRELPPTAVDDAKANLSRFEFVGIQERFDESVALLQRLVGLDFVPSADRHVNRLRPSVDDLPAEEKALIEEHNKLDLELYEFGVGLLADALSGADERFDADARRLRELSAAANEADEEEVQVACEFLDRELPPGTEKLGSVVEAAAEAAGLGRQQLKRGRRRLGVEGVPHPEREDVFLWRRPDPAAEPESYPGRGSPTQ